MSILVLAAPAFAGCLDKDRVESLADAVAADQVAQKIEVARDAEGDARVYGAEAVRGIFTGKCGVTPSAARPACWTGTGAAADAFQPPPGTGLPEPALDVLSAAFSETPTSLIVELSIGSLDPSFAGIVADDGEVTGGWALCWIPRGDPTVERGDEATECVHLYAESYDGTLILQPTFERNNFDCNDWGWCIWMAPHEIEYGSPSVLRLAVPRAIMGGADVGDALEVYRYSSWRQHRPAVLHAYHASLGLDVLGNAEGLGLGNDHSYRTDESAEHGVFTFQTTREEGVPQPLVETAIHEAGDASREEIDALSFAFIEAPDSWTISVQVGRVDPSPLDHDYWIGFGMPSGRFHMAGYSLRDGRLDPWAAHSVDSSLAEWVAYPADFRFAAGAPGWINLTIARADLQSPMAGGLVNLVDVVLSYGTLDWSLPQAGGAGEATAYVGGLNDGMLAPPYWFWMDTV